jgi:Tc toxin complex TcA C-terminal TcB-binding domain
MANGYLVIRLHPDSPVDSGTFGSYLDGLEIQIYAADQPQSAANLLGQVPPAGQGYSPASLIPVPWDGSVLVTTNLAAAATAYNSGQTNYGKTIEFGFGAGIIFGSTASGPAKVPPQQNPLFPSNTTVTDIPAPASSSSTATTVTFSETLGGYAAEGTAVTFYYQYAAGDITLGANNESFSLTRTPSAAVNSKKTVSFSNTAGIAVGMQASAASTANVQADTFVTGVSSTSVTFSKGVTLTKTTAVTFTFNLNFGIVQHVENLPFDTPIGQVYVPIPASVATAVVPISGYTAGKFMDIQVVATRTDAAGQNVPIPVDNNFYNIIVTAGSPPTPDQYQSIPLQETSLYITLPAPPPAAAISLPMPSDGTPPKFSDLYPAIVNALKDDPTFSSSTAAAVAALTADQCSRLAYDIVWSQQNALPLPPDPLESLYTDPPNDGTSNNNDEQDRQHFEGNLDSFYATRNANAQQLAKYVYAAAAALWCEQRSLIATQVMLEFPVKPGQASNAPVGEASVILTGIGNGSPTDINFGVPAAFFYALGATLATQVTPLQRYQMACGDTIDRLLADLSNAVQAGTIDDSMQFYSLPQSPPPPSATSAQAARRIAALGVSPTSPTPFAPLGTIAAQITANAAAASLTVASATGISSGMIVAGSGIPVGTTVSGNPTAVSGEFSVPLAVPASTTITAVQGTLVTFTPPFNPNFAALLQDWLNYSPPASDTTPSSLVYQPSDDEQKFWPAEASKQQTAFLELILAALTQNYFIPPPVNAPLGTKIEQWLPTLTVPKGTAGANVNTLDQVSAAQWTAFFQAAIQITATVNGAPSGAIVPVKSTTGIIIGMMVSGPGIVSGTTVTALTAATSITLAPPPGSIPNGATLSFQVAATVNGAPSGTTVPVKQTAGIVVGMVVSGPGIAAGTTVVTVTSNTSITLSANPGAIPSNATLTFASPSWLPPFTQPGSTTVQISAFVRYVKTFFDMPPPMQPTNFSAAAGSPSTFGISSDWLQDCINAYQTATGTKLTFGNDTLNATAMAAATVTVFGGDPAAAWALEALQAIDQLALMVNGVTSAATPSPPAVPINANTHFSMMEALYARGFTSVQQVRDLTAGQFTQALAGTIAYDYAAQLYAAAKGSKQPPSPGNGSLIPVNPDGCLTNCVPPPCRSPLGPIAYLKEMLDVSQASTCANPAAAGTPTLGTVIASRRGDVGTLAASCANLETPLPLIDLVDECLEFMGSVATATTPATCGAVYNTSADVLAGHLLCKEQRCPPEEEPRGCHDPATIFAALPECSTPATPIAANANVDPAVYNNLKVDFSSCCLPYSQALDVNRTYLRHFRSSRFEEMRTFRKCITEFVLTPEQEPAGFQSYRRQYPVRIDIAIEYLGITPEEYQLLFQGCPAPPCAAIGGGRGDDAAPASPAAPAPTPNAAAAGNTAPPAVSSPAVGPPATPAPTPPPAPVGGNTPPSAQSLTAVAPSSGPSPWQLYGFATQTVTGPPWPQGTSWLTVLSDLSQFLARTCLTYCEFLELQQCGFVTFRNGSQDVGGQEGRDRSQGDGTFPDCPPCYLDKTIIDFGSGDGLAATLEQLAIFIRLWRLLKRNCGGYSFAELRDICDVLQLFKGSPPNAALNSDFVRQLAAFQMLREDLRLPLTDPAAKPSATAIDADRTQLLALWAPNAAKWPWAVRILVEHVEQYALRHYGCERRPEKFLELMLSKLDPLSQLAGFDPTTAANTWHALPTHTLRFAEVLAKIYASDFTIGELFYLFTMDEPLYGESPFPLQDGNEALGFPLDLPHDQGEHTLWHLRHKLLGVEATEEAVEEWSWKRIEAELQNFFGFANADVLALGTHFFPRVLEHAGYQVDAKSGRFFSDLAAKSTDPAMWTASPPGPFQYDSNAGQLSIAIPLVDGTVIAKLTHLHALNTAEMTAVQDLYFQPRALLARFALLLADFPVAEKHLVEDRNEEERWSYFRRQFVRCHRRCHIIAEHLSRHVATASGQECPEGEAPALLILRELFADENKLLPTATDPNPNWENNDGTHPGVTWTPPPNGGAFAALLALVGTGLAAEYKQGGTTVWRNVCGPLSAFDRERDKENCPVPTVLPAMSATITQSPSQSVSALNGFLIANGTGACLGGAQGFDVTWCGALLVEHDGTYEFCAGVPTPDGEMPDIEAAEQRQWRVTLKRGQRSWTLLTHLWPSEVERAFASLTLRRGAYDLTVEFVQPAPNFQNEAQIKLQRTGFQIKYSGPDSHGQRIEIPHDRLFCLSKDQTLGTGIAGLSPCAATFLGELYVGSLRDIRRTYQRAFKALLFAHRFALSAVRREGSGCELGYMLAQGVNFAGTAFFLSNNVFTLHAADFDFNYLPVNDDYYPPTPAQDSRAAPSPQRIQAMFDWWERLFDYARMRREVHHRCGRHVWHLFDEALQKQPADPGYLLREIGADQRHWQLDLNYYQGQSSGIYTVSSTDLEDDRWAVRAWHAEEWLRALQRSFATKDIAKARPDLWASDDPSAPVFGQPSTETGNSNLSAFLCDSCLEGGGPPRHADIKRLNDGLRERGRDALVAYLCRMNRVELPWKTGVYAQSARDLTDLLLIDTEAGICERASRIQEAITAVQNFVRRARLGLEPAWTITPEFALMWERRFATFHIWEACHRRELYKENWIDWNELGKARRIESFRFLESELRRNTLSIARPGGVDWWPDQSPPQHPALLTLQEREPSGLAAIGPPREGLTLGGQPERDAHPSWLAPLSIPSQSGGSGPTQPGGSNAAPSSSATPATPSLPFWMQAAIRQGQRFYRIAAAGAPPAASAFRPHGHDAEPACCAECGRVHPPLVDEYYFWLVDAVQYSEPSNNGQGGDQSPEPLNYEFGFQNDYYDPTQQDAIPWQDETRLPTLLAWQPNPAVRLAWCRVHDGVFQQPRRSADCVTIGSGTTDLVFSGRQGDSLTFQVTTGQVPTGYSSPGDPTPDTTPPGFRYDIAEDCAVTLPLLVAPPAPPSPSNYPGGFPAYPFFVYVSPGATLFPYSPFGPALAVASSLRAHCRFEAALNWYRFAFDPLTNDCTWVDCPNDWRRNPNSGNTLSAGASSPSQAANPGVTAVAVGVEGPASSGGATPTQAGSQVAPASSLGETLAVAAPAPAQAGGANAVAGSAPTAGAASTQTGNQVAVASNAETNEPAAEACCQSTAVTDAAARDRSILLHYIETLLEWSAALMRRHSPESFQQARLVLETAARILGPRPYTVCAEDVPSTQTVTNFVPAFAPLNPRLLDAYDRVADGLEAIRHCLDDKRLRNGLPRCDMPYFGHDPFRDGWRSTVETCPDEAEWCYLHSPYRFAFLIQKAQELAGKVRELGSALLSAFEKGDAGALASLRAGHEREVFELGLAGRQDQWRDADWQVEALQKTKEVNQANLLYYNNLIQAGLIDDEIQYEILTVVAMVARAAANITEAIGGTVKIIPDFWVGFPCEEAQIPSGTKLAGTFESAARIINVVGDIANTVAGLDLTQAGWDRRAADWVHQSQVLTIEIQQIERQILGAQRRRDQAMHDLNTHSRQMEHAAEVQNFLRDQFTAPDLYLWLQKETTALYFRMYELALRAARQAEFAYNFERGHTTRRFIPEQCWDDLHEGLLAGERLDLALHHMEKAYLDRNVREYELTKHFSLRLHFPKAYLRLRTTGYCEIELPEWMFDLDYPGQYMRRIKNITLTIPCQTGPYTGVHCRLTLLSSMTRIDPRLPAPVHQCCCDDAHCCDYDTCGEDPRVVRQYAAREAIATSSGQNDSCMFELNFRDERYLPFEYLGAVSRWRIELPFENNAFDFDTLSDVVLNLNYTAREGGAMLRRAASESAECYLREGRWGFFDVRHEFPDAWQLFRDRDGHFDHERDQDTFGERGHSYGRDHGREQDRRLDQHDHHGGDYNDDDHRREGNRSHAHGRHSGDHLREREGNGHDRKAERRLDLRLDRNMFPFIPGHRAVELSSLVVMFETHDAGAKDHCEVEFRHTGEGGHNGERSVQMHCVKSCDWPRLYHGTVDVTLAPLSKTDRDRRATLSLPRELGRIERVFVFWRYRGLPTDFSRGANDGEGRKPYADGKSRPASSPPSRGNLESRTTAIPSAT